MIRFSPLLLAVTCLLALAVTCPAASLSDFIDFTLYNPNGTVKLPGRLHVPPNYDPGKRYPIIVYLHGYNVGSDNTVNVTSMHNNLMTAARAREAFVLAPRSPIGLWAESGTVNTRPQMRAAIEMLDVALATYNIDANRQYVTGHSAGGSGTWEAAGKFPGRFAAAVPLAADYIRQQPISGVLAQTPVWAYHARDDNSGNEIRFTREMVNNILNQGYGRPRIAFPLDEPDGKDFYDGTPYYPSTGSLGATFFEYEMLRYTEYFTGGHGITGRVYGEAQLYEWMFSQSLAVPEPGSLTLLGVVSMLMLRRRRAAARPVSSRCSCPRRAGRGFTLIELLVVVSIIALLIAMLLPALQTARAAAREVTCISQLRQVNFAQIMYTHDSKGAWPLKKIRNTGSAFDQWNTYEKHGLEHMLGDYLGKAVILWQTPTQPVWICPQRRTIHAPTNTDNAYAGLFYHYRDNGAFQAAAGLPASLWHSRLFTRPSAAPFQWCSQRNNAILAAGTWHATGGRPTALQDGHVKSLANEFYKGFHKDLYSSQSILHHLRSNSPNGWEAGDFALSEH